MRHRLLRATETTVTDRTAASIIATETETGTETEIIPAILTPSVPRTENPARTARTARTGSPVRTAAATVIMRTGRRQRQSLSSSCQEKKRSTICLSLQSEKLHALLDKYNYQLEFKLHPIFNCYKHLYNIKSDRITFAKNTTKNSDYNICITDYSSFVFDFVYLKRSIIYFFPDYTLFKAGLNLYRELDLPIEEGFGNLVTTADEAINDIEKLLINKGQPNKKYIDRMNKLFLFNDNNQRDRIYEELMKE